MTNYPKGYKTCNKCKTPYLHWISVGGHWKLSNDPYGKSLHRCPTKKESTDKVNDNVITKPSFEINERVEIIYDKNGAVGLFGRVIHISNTNTWDDEFIAIELDNTFILGHDCLGLCEFGRGYYTHVSSIKKSFSIEV